MQTGFPRMSTVLEQDHFCSDFLNSFATETTNSQTRDDEVKAAPLCEGTSTSFSRYDFEDHNNSVARVKLSEFYRLVRQVSKSV